MCVSLVAKQLRLSSTFDVGLGWLWTIIAVWQSRLRTWWSDLALMCCLRARVVLKTKDPDNLRTW